MKLNYTSLQHAVVPVEDEQTGAAARAARGGARAARAARRGGVGVRRARAGSAARVRADRGRGAARRALAHGRELRERGLLAGHITAGAAFGGESEAITTAGALHHGLRALGWDAAVCGPGPGIVGSGSPLGHGGMAALDSAHARSRSAAPTLLVARMSSGDERARHRAISHHTLTVLDLLLAPVTVALPAGMRSPVGTDLRAGLGRGVRRHRPRAGPSRSPTSSARRASRATTGAARRSTCPRSPRAALAGETMGRGPPRTRCSSVPRSPPAACSRS